MRTITIPRRYIDSYTGAIEDERERFAAELEQALAMVDYDRPVAEVRDEVVRIMDAYCGPASEVSARLSADFYDGLRERTVGERMGAWAESGRDPAATDGAVRAFAQDLVDRKPTEDFIKKCVSRLGYEVRRAAGTSIQSNAERDPLRPRYARVPAGGETCEFCIMLASRGPVYRSAERAGMLDHWHDNCRCSVVPMWNTYYVGPSRRASASMSIEGYDPDALYEEYVDTILDSDALMERMARAAELAKLRHPEHNDWNTRGRPNAQMRRVILSDALGTGRAKYSDLYEMGEAIRSARTYEELVELVKQLNRELPLHFPKESELRVLKEKLMARRKQLID